MNKELIIKALNKMLDMKFKENIMVQAEVDLINFYEDYVWTIQYLFAYIFNDAGFELIYDFIYYNETKDNDEIKTVEDLVDHLFNYEERYFND